MESPDARLGTSHNVSTNGEEILAQFCSQMREVGIPVKRVQPPYELDRVQHWNWAHGQAEARWLKPLFVGDLLKPAYVERVRKRVEARPQAQAVRCEFEMRTGTQVRTTRAPFKEEGRLGKCRRR